MRTFLRLIVLIILLVIVVFDLAASALACDTWVALAGAAARGAVLFGKNSDRLLFDSQPLMFNPRADWPQGAVVDLGRLQIPQVRKTWATLGSSPYWCWGYEEGINEWGVIIGNEGVWTKPLLEAVSLAGRGNGPAAGPTGMDLLRLGLERGRTAREALKVITSLVERYGQFGSGIPTTWLEGAYDNSFLIADAGEAWVLETAGRQWVARRFRRGTTSISNKLSLATDWDLASPGAVDEAVRKGWWSKDKAARFDFTAAYHDDSPSNQERTSRTLARQTCSAGLLRKSEGRHTIRTMMGIARDRSSNPAIDLDVTASSCVAEIPEADGGLPVFWWCAATPSRSCYIPFFVHGSRVPEILSAPGTAGRRIVPPDRAVKDGFSEGSFWWLFRDLCDKVNADAGTRLPAVRAEFDALEKEFAAGVPEVAGRAWALRKAGKTADAARILDEYSEACVDRVLDTVRRLRANFAEAVAGPVPEIYRPYVGTYEDDSGPLRGREFKALVRNGKLAVDIPGQMVAELREPDERGLRFLVLSRDVAFSFETGSAGSAKAMNLHQTTTLRRTGGSAESGAASAPAGFGPCLGTYELPAARIEITVRVEDSRLVLDIKGQGVVILLPADADGRRVFSDDPAASVSFVMGADGQASALKLHRIFRLPRKE